MIHRHKPYYNGREAHCRICGSFLYDLRTGPKLAALTDVDPELVWVARQRFPRDPELAYRLAHEDMRKVVSTIKMSDKLHDFLMNPKSRPDLQTPEAQQFLKTLDTNYHNPKTDALMPWLTREYKKGRIKPGEGSEPGVLQAEFGPEYEHEAGRYHRLMPATLDHWADWYGSNHPSRQGQDIMQMKSPEMHQTIQDWDTDMREKARDQAQVRGDQVHSYPDGWSIQNLNTEKALKDEGETMGHCVGGYYPQIESGRSQIFSLRDHQNNPHATIEVRPKFEGADGTLYDHHEEVPEGQQYNITPRQSQMVQIQGKGNEAPIEPYQKRIKDWMETMPEEDRPRWQPQTTDDAEEFMDGDDQNPYGYQDFTYYHPGDYGLQEPKITHDFDNILDTSRPSNHGGESWYHQPDDLLKKASEYGKEEELASRAQNWLKAKREEQAEHRNDQWNQVVERNPEMNDHIADPYSEEGYHELPQEEQDAREEQYYKETGENELRQREDWEHERYGWQGQGPEKEFDDDYYDEWESALARQGLRAQRGEAEQWPEPPQQTISKLARKQFPHPNFNTGEPCYCTFNAHEPMWHEAVFMDEVPGTCPTCGDPLTHGKCQRCDWSAGPSNAMTDGEPIADPTKEIKPAIQS